MEAGNLSCMSGGATCFRNRIYWTHHRKFDAVSSVFQTDSAIDFGGEPPQEEVVAGEEGGVTAPGGEEAQVEAPPTYPEIPDPK